jgi:hypothetical protein
LKNNPDLVSTPLLLPLAARERIKTINAEKGNFRFRVKSLGFFLCSEPILLGKMFNIFWKSKSNWHGFSLQALCHNVSFFLLKTHYFLKKTS